MSFPDRPRALAGTALATLVGMRSLLSRRCGSNGRRCARCRGCGVEPWAPSSETRPRSPATPLRSLRNVAKRPWPSSRFDETSSRFDEPSPRFDLPSSRFDQTSPRFDPPSSRFDQTSPPSDQPSSRFASTLARCAQPSSRSAQPTARFDETPSSKHFDPLSLFRDDVSLR